MGLWPPPDVTVTTHGGGELLLRLSRQGGLSTLSLPRRHRP